MFGSMGSTWVVNDLMTTFDDCYLTTRVLDAAGRQLTEQVDAAGKVVPDSSAAKAEVTWKVDAALDDAFRVELQLRDAKGELLSANHYDFLIGDQELARQQCRTRAQAVQEFSRKAQRADYYRYFPNRFDGEHAVQRHPAE